MKKSNKTMRLALVYDWVNKFGGAERVLLALHEIWPEASLFTAVYNKQKASWADLFQVKSSFLQFLPFAKNRHELFLPLTSYAFESFDFSNFDMVLSVTSADAKSIITKPSSLHLCYCLTPARYLWSGYNDYLLEPGMSLLNPLIRLMMKLIIPCLRQWDWLASNRPDCYLAISETVARRIQAYYRQKAEIIYPPVDLEIFKPAKRKISKDYFLIVSRLVPYKRIDYVISAFNQLGWNLKIVGCGLDEKRLKKMAESNVEFLGGDLTDEKLCWYYQKCQAFIFPGEEDFGLAAVEAQACGKPVIGLKRGGIGEIIIDGQTGETYDFQTKEALIAALKLFKQKKYSEKQCRQNVLRFSKEKFKKQMKSKIESIWQDFQNNL